MAPDVSEIRRVLQVYDNASVVPTKQALRMLEGITKAIAKAPADFDLLDDPSELPLKEQQGQQQCAVPISWQPALLSADVQN